MGWRGYLALWCAVCGALAVVGFGRSLAGATRAQRAVRVRGRIVRVGEVRHGGSGRYGIPVVVSYRDPATGGEVVVTNDGERGDRISAAWTGREVGVRYPPGHPHAYRFTDAGQEAGRGLGLPVFALFLVWAGLVAGAALEWGWPWLLVGFAGPWAVSIACYLPGNVRDVRARREKLASMVEAGGRFVAVLKDVSTDSEGAKLTTVTPVVAFTTRDGEAVTAYCVSGVADPAGARGREVTLHYRPDDPALFTLDHAGDQRSLRSDVGINVAGLVVVTAAAVAGVVLL
ncbi:DUF3592 domain-containing protein [Kitasatospora sp. NPDC056446]|uniref:DUF3592 domain-containing protein n=1 Tax=Kitasatospora sp. NPDC056446 TaxID=3345819 RepID=UPI00369ACE91